MADTATFIGTDTTTQGTWIGVYGSAGYHIIGDTTSNPSWVTPSFSGGSDFNFGAPSAPISVQKADNSARVRQVKFAGATQTINLSVTDGNKHYFSIYCADYDSGGRAQNMVFKTSGGTTLDTQSVSSFSAGKWLTWVIEGDVKLEITHTSGSNSVWSALMFDDIPPARLTTLITQNLRGGITPSSRVTDVVVQNIRGGITPGARLSGVGVQNLRGGITPASRVTATIVQLLKSPTVPPGNLTTVITQNLRAAITPPVRVTGIVVQALVFNQQIVGDAILDSTAEVFEDGMVALGIVGLSLLDSTENVIAGGVVYDADAPAGGGSEFRITVQAADKTSLYRDATLRVDLQYNLQGSASFDLYDEDGIYLPEEGQKVYLEYYDAGIPEINNGDATNEWHPIFAGKIVSVERSKPGLLHSQTGLLHSIQCADYTSWIAKRRISRKYSSGKTLAYILSDIETNFLIPEGLTWVNSGTATETLGEIVWSNVSIVEALNFLANSTNKSWIFDTSGALRMETSPSLGTAPFTIEENTDQLWANLKVRVSLDLYANTVILSSSAQIVNPPQESEMDVLTIENTDSFPYFRYFDGIEYKDYTWKGQVKRITEILINGTSRPFFVNGETPPDPWYFVQITEGDIDLLYNHGDHGFLSSGDTVTVKFEVSTSSVPPVTASDPTEIAARKAIEGGTGIHEISYSVENITDTTQLQQMADAILEKSKIKGVTVTADVLAYGLLPGHELPGSTFASYGVTSPVDLRVDSVSMFDVGGGNRRLHTQVVISNSNVQRDGITAIRNLIEKIKTATSAGAGSGGSGGGGSSDLPITINLALGTPSVPSSGLVVGTNVTNVLALDQDFSPRSISVIAKTPPVGSPFTIMIQANGANILTSDISYPETGGLLYFNAQLITDIIPAGSYLTVNVTSVGSTDPGGDVTIVLTGRV